MYGSHADAQRQLSPQGARHGHGRPPYGRPPGKVWAIARTVSNIFGWPLDEAEALPPLATSGPHASSSSGHIDDGAVQRPSTAHLGSQSNENY